MNNNKHRILIYCFVLAALAYGGYTAISVLGKLGDDQQTYRPATREITYQGRIKARFRAVFRGSWTGLLTQRTDHSYVQLIPSANNLPSYKAPAPAYASHGMPSASSGAVSSSSLMTLSSDASLKSYGGGNLAAAGGVYASSTTTSRTQAPQLYASSAVSMRKASVRNIVSVAHEAEDEAIAMSAPRRASILPPPPVEEPDEEKQLGYVEPLGDVSFALITLFIGVYLAVRAYLRRRKTIAR